MRLRSSMPIAGALLAAGFLTLAGCDANPATQRVTETPSGTSDDAVGEGGGMSGDGIMSPDVHDSGAEEAYQSKST